MSSLPVEKLEVWKVACQLGTEILDLTASGPLSEDYIIKKQLRSASISVAANISEGYDRYSHREFIRFLNISRASLNEVRTHMRIIADSRTYNFPQYKQLDQKYARLSIMLLKLIQSRRKMLRAG